MVIGTALMWGNVETMVLAIALAFVFGYSFTLFAVRRAGLDFKTAIKVALAADTVSIAVMELIDNGIMLLVPGAMEAGSATFSSGAPSRSPWWWPAPSPSRSTDG